MKRHNITAKVADGLIIYAPTASEPDVEAGGEHQVVALIIGDILQ